LIELQLLQLGDARVGEEKGNFRHIVGKTALFKNDFCVAFDEEMYETIVEPMSPASIAAIKEAKSSSSSSKKQRSKAEKAARREAKAKRHADKLARRNANANASPSSSSRQARKPRTKRPRIDDAG
jgi:hypothetical protein